MNSIASSVVHIMQQSGILSNEIGLLYNVASFQNNISFFLCVCYNIYLYEYYLKFLSYCIINADY
jgi:hypothetical protein